MAKFYLSPTIILDKAYDIKSSELQELMKVVEENREKIERCWYEYFGE